jgi:hypothetical protein
MTTYTTEPAPRLRALVAPLALVSLAIYVFFVALAMEVYLLLAPALLLLALGIAPARALLRRR